MNDGEDTISLVVADRTVILKLESFDGGFRCAHLTCDQAKQLGYALIEMQSEAKRVEPSNG